MSFLFTAALAIALFVAAPIAAHLLRRGRAREREFPPAFLVPPAPPVARQRSRLEDRALLLLRGALILALAVLGAVPFVRCSRLSLARQAGASVAISIVLDDSASMRVEVDGKARWERAHDAARSLLRSAREGDAVAIVLAGRPARLALAATTDLSAVRATLDALTVTDRPTDLANAVKLARSALTELPHVDQRVLLLSDLAGDELPTGTPPAWMPVPDLALSAENCGIVRADRRGGAITASVACTHHDTAAGRRLEVLAAAPRPAPAPSASSAAPAPPSEGTLLGAAPLVDRGGLQSVVVELDAAPGELDVRLTGKDASPHDDSAPVATEAATSTVGVLADVTSASGATGGPPVVEQALAALEAGVVVRPLTLLPADVASLAPLSALVLDDPAALGPEARETLTNWIRRGGVALALLGPRVGRGELGATLEPFVSSAVVWSETTPRGIEPKTAAALGPEASALGDLLPRGRVALAGAVPERSRILARWTDGVPFVFERELGRGLILTAALPASPSLSDLALRPGFLALLGYGLEEALRRRGPRVSVAGAPWVFHGDARVQVTLPTGAERELAPDREPDAGGVRIVFTPELAGRYRVTRDGETQGRVVTLDAAEVLDRPRDPAAVASAVRTGGVAERVDISRELALLVLLLFAAELVARAVMRFRDRRTGERRKAETVG